MGSGVTTSCIGGEASAADGRVAVAVEEVGADQAEDAALAAGAGAPATDVGKPGWLDATGWVEDIGAAT